MLPVTPNSSPHVDILVIDTIFALYRAFCVTPPLSNSKGFPTNALHGGFGSLLRMVEELRPHQVVLALEGGPSDTDTQRTETFSEYKAQRKPFPPQFTQQIPVVIELAQALGWHTLEVPGYEADDVIASICAQYPEAQKVIFTTDKDILSLTDSHTRVYERKKQKSCLLESEDISLKWEGLQPRQILEVLSLAGDKIDNIPGVCGIGRKSAIALVHKYGTAHNVYRHLSELPKAQQTRLQKGRATFDLSYQLVRLETRLPLPDLSQTPKTCLTTCRNLTDLYALHSIYKRIQRSYNHALF